MKYQPTYMQRNYGNYFGPNANNTVMYQQLKPNQNQMAVIQTKKNEESKVENKMFLENNNYYMNRNNQYRNLMIIQRQIDYQCKMPNKEIQIEDYMGK